MIDRRRFLQGLAAAGALAPAACASGTGRPAPPGPALVLPGDGEVVAAETRRPRPAGRGAAYDLVARVAEVDLGGAVASTWTYGGTVPGPLLRARAGDTLEVRLTNELPEDTVIHWHGLHLRNDMDGVHHVTQAPVRPGERFTYRFALDAPGTYWFHPHHGLQLDRGLYAPLIVDDPAEAGAPRRRARRGARRLDRRARGHARRRVPGPARARAAAGPGRRVPFAAARRGRRLVALPRPPGQRPPAGRGPDVRRAGPAGASACGSSTPAPRPPTGSPSAATG